MSSTIIDTTRKRDPGTLTNTANVMSAMPQYQPEGGATKCNFFLIDFANTVFGCHDLDGLMANQMVLDGFRLHDFFKPLYDRTKGFSDRDAAFQNAQSYANSGYLIIYGWYNSAGHGHVMVGVPGSLQEGWGGVMVPSVAQAGETVSPSMRLSGGLRLERGNSDDFVVYGWL